MTKSRRFLSGREKLRTILIVGAYGSMLGSSLMKNTTGPVEGL